MGRLRRCQEVTVRRRRLACTAMVLLALGGCSDAPGTPSSSPASRAASSTTAAATPTSASPSPTTGAPTPPVGTRPVVQCLNGRYRLAAFTDVRTSAAYRSGRGGDVELRFTGEEFPDGNYVGTAYRVVATGKRAVTLTAPDGTRSTLLVRMDAVGSYTLANSEAVFARRPGKGSGRLTTGGTTRTLDLPAVQEIVTPVGTLTVSCTRTTLWLTGDQVQYELTAD